MSREVKNWDDAAADVFSHLNEKKREFSLKNSLSLLDDLCLRGSASEDDLIQKHGHADFIRTILGHVTTAVHGKGSVPKQNGWYQTTASPHGYLVHPSFVEAWKRKRRL